MRLSGIAFLLPTFCVLVDAERAEGKVSKKNQRANTLQVQESDGADIILLKNTHEANALQARGSQHAEVKSHKDTENVNDLQVQATRKEDPCDGVWTLLVGNTVPEWNADSVTAQIYSDMQALRDDNTNNVKKKEQAQRVQQDIQHFFSHRDFAQTRKVTEYQGMFSKHLAYRCEVLGLGCQDALARAGGSCWCDSGRCATRIVWSQNDVTATYNGHNTVDAIAMLPDANLLVDKSIYTIANLLMQQNQAVVPDTALDKDYFFVAVGKKDGKWVAWNNRAFTTHVLARVPPLRIFPRFGSSQESQRNVHEIMLLKPGEGANVPTDINSARNFGIVWPNGNSWTRIPLTVPPPQYEHNMDVW